QAEAGIRDRTVTGVQTCALPIFKGKGFQSPYLKSFVVARVNPLRFMKTVPPFDDALDTILRRAGRFDPDKVKQQDITAAAAPLRSEERRVGKEGRWRCAGDHDKK